MLFWHATKKKFRTSQYKVFLSIVRRFAAIPIFNNGTQFEPPVWGIRVNLGGQKWYQSNVVPTFLFDFYAHHRFLAPFGHNIQRGRQTERATPIGRLIYSIGGLVKL